MNDITQHVDRLRRLPQQHDQTLRTLFEPRQPIFVARAPGRLDVMGGIGDYSGSLVLELPIAEAAFAAVQLSQTGDVTIASRRHSAGSNATSSTITAREWTELQNGDWNEARQFFAGDPSSAWAAYVAGPVLVLLRETAAHLNGGLRILIDSQVPEGKGVSSSAAIEVATMRAISALLGIDLPGEQMARLCQLAENHIAGAPCGIMDQMTAAFGRQYELLALRCQPATMEPFVPIPAGVEFWGIDSGVRHAVSGSDYASVRCGAFMGYRMIADAAGLQVRPSVDAPDVVDIDDPIWNGYLANISSREFETRFSNAIPKQITGRAFLERYRGITDRVTRIDPTRTYAVRAPTLHPIQENERAQRFRSLLQNPVDENPSTNLADSCSQHTIAIPLAVWLPMPPTCSSTWSAAPTPRAVSMAPKSLAAAAAEPSPSSAAPAPTKPSPPSPENIQNSRATNRTFSAVRPPVRMARQSNKS
jgi:galactokinase